jgi:hypothetical protein
LQTRQLLVYRADRLVVPAYPVRALARLGRTRLVLPEASPVGHRGKAIRFRRLACAVLPVLCSACSPSQVLAQSRIAHRLLAYSVQHCPVESVVEQSGLYRIDALAKAREWFYDSVLRSKRARIVWKNSDSFHSSGELTYVSHGEPLHVWWHDYHPPDILARQKLVVRACLFVPKRDKLLDMDATGGGTDIRVLYLPELGYSWIGKELLRRGLLRGNNFFEAQSYLRVAGVRRAEGGRWQVVVEKDR